MRSLKQLTKDIVRKPPILCPLVGLFHVLWFLWTIYDDRHEPLDIAWLQVLWLTGFTLFWIAACDLQKWGAIGYFALTLIDAVIYFAVRNHMANQEYLSNMFLLDGLFSFFLLFYYKKFS